MNLKVIKFDQTIPVDPAWLKFVQFARAHPFCEVKVIIKNSVPVMLEQAIENFKLSS